MKKIKIQFPQEDFGTLNTKYPVDSSKVANDDFTNGTKNLETSVKGVITKRKGGQVYSTLPTPPRDQFEAIFSDGTRHLLTVDNGVLRYSSGDGMETSVLSGLSTFLNFEFSTIQDRVYFGNGITKKVYDKITNYGGVTYTFPSQTVKDIGAQTPGAAAVAALVVDSTVNQVPAGVHKYKVTFVYYDSEESNGGPASNSVTNDATHTSNSLTSVPIGGYGVTQRKIYRDDNNDVYTLVGVISNNTSTTFTDNLAAGLTPLLDDQGLPPDFTLITSYLDRLFLAGIPGDPYSIFFSEVGMPDIYPAFNTLTCNQEDPITGIVVYLDRLVVFNRRSMGQVLGKTSDTFRYAAIQSSVGCVDNRSIQIRVIDGVPVLVWLSDKGFYAYNGNSVVYISDVIEDQINANIQQAVVQRNRISHSDYTSFTSGTKSDGINLEANQGTITTKGPYWDTVAHPGATYEEQTNPKKLWDTQTEWNNGTTKQNLVLDGTQTVKSPLRFAPTIESGTLNNLIIDSGSVKIPTYANFSGESNLTGTYPQYQYNSPYPNQVAVPIIPTRTGTLTQIRIFGYHVDNPPLSNIGTVTIQTDSSGSPSGSSVSGGTGTIVLDDNTSFHDSTIMSTILTGSTKYWIVITTPSGYGFSRISHKTALSGGSCKVKRGANAWELSMAYPAGNPAGITQNDVAMQYSFVMSAVPDSGTWQSPIYDSSSISIVSGVNAALSASYPSGSYPSGPYSTSSSFQLQASNDPFMITGVVTETFNNLNGVSLSTLSAKQYWRIFIVLSTTDKRATPAISSPQIRYLNLGIWESEVIDCTLDVSSYQSLVTNKIEPSGTSVTTKIATSSSPLGPWTYVLFGSHVVLQYVKLRLELATNSINSVVPTVNSVLFTWSVGNGTSLSSFISSAIDTGATPSGWDIFQASYATNGGSIQFALRSASTSGGLTAATWYNVNTGEFPDINLPVLQWVQWRAIIQSNPDQVPTIDSVTVGWFVGTASQGIRCASIFYNKNYYVALSEFGNTYNNLLYVLDFTGQWRLFKDIDIATIGYFFNNPYYGDATTSKIVKFLEGNSDQGDPIELEVHTKGFDGSTQWTDNDDKIKVLDHVIVNCTNTGASFDCYYSIDEGVTFNPLYDTSGNITWTTLTDGKEVFKYLRPRYTQSIPQGRTLLFKIHNNDTKEVQIKSLKAEAFVREQPPIITG